MGAGYVPAVRWAAIQAISVYSPQLRNPHRR
jgi:hypothetical protein